MGPLPRLPGLALLGALLSPAAAAPAEVTVGFGSCLMQSGLQPEKRQGYRPYRVLRRLMEHQLDSMIFMGDAVYGDFPDFYSSKCCSQPPYPTCDTQCFENGTIGTPEQLDAQYRLLLEDVHFDSFVSKVPSVFTWDDHELFDNYREGTGHVHYATARSAFERHLASKHNPPAYRRGELYFVHAVPAERPLGEFFVLDGRSHRSRSGMLGQQQLDDLKAWLSAPTRAPWRLIVSSTMFADVASGVGSDNWSLYAEEKRKVLDHVYDSGAQGVMLLSGDAHFVAAVEHRARRGESECRVLEFASSPLASVPLRPRRAPSSYTGLESGFDERVFFLQSASSLYATLRLSEAAAVVRLYRFEDRASGDGRGTEVLLKEITVPRSPLCAPAGQRAPSEEL